MRLILVLLNGDTSVFTWKNNTYENGAKVVKFYTTTYNPKNKITISCINDIWKVNNKQTGKADSVGNWKSTNNTLMVFGRSKFANGVKDIRPFYENMYLYSLKIWDNETLIRNYIPVVENGYKNEPCLYDLVEEKFYYNQGTGTFETD